MKKLEETLNRRFMNEFIVHARLRPSTLFMRTLHYFSKSKFIPFPANIFCIPIFKQKRDNCRHTPFTLVKKVVSDIDAVFKNNFDHYLFL